MNVKTKMKKNALLHIILMKIYLIYQNMLIKMVNKLID